MTKLEHFKQWAMKHYPHLRQDDADNGNGIYFQDRTIQSAWQSFQHAFTVRPTTNTRLNAAEFMKDEPETIVDRLNGIFPTADPPYKMTPLHYEAAREIERLRGLIAEIERMVKLNAPDDYADIAGQLSEILNKKPAEAG